MKLSPMTSYYIRKLLRQASSATEVARLDTDLDSSFSDLDEVLHRLYSDATTTAAIQKLENLVFLHSTLSAQSSLYAGYMEEARRIEQQIFQVLGCQKATAC